MVGWVGGVVAHRILVSAPGPLGLIRFLNWVGLGWGLALEVWGQGLTIRRYYLSVSHLYTPSLRTDDILRRAAQTWEKENNVIIITLLSCEEMQGGRIPCNPFNMDTFPSPYIPVMINHYLCSALSIRCGSESCNIQKIYEEK